MVQTSQCLTCLPLETTRRAPDYVSNPSLAPPASASQPAWCLPVCSYVGRVWGLGRGEPGVCGSQNREDGGVESARTNITLLARQAGTILYGPQGLGRVRSGWRNEWNQKPLGGPRIPGAGAMGAPDHLPSLQAGTVGLVRSVGEHAAVGGPWSPLDRAAPTPLTCESSVMPRPEPRLGGFTYTHGQTGG